MMYFSNLPSKRTPLERENHRFTIKQNWIAKAILEKTTKNNRRSTASERVEEPKEKRSKKDSTSSNGNENLRSEIVVNEYPQKPKK